MKKYVKNMPVTNILHIFVERSTKYFKLLITNDLYFVKIVLYINVEGVLML